jgi:hypothetical protein
MSLGVSLGLVQESHPVKFRQLSGTSQGLYKHKLQSLGPNQALGYTNQSLELIKNEHLTQFTFKIYIS